MEEQKAGAGLTTGDRYLVQLLDYLRLWELGKDGGVHQPVITDYEGQLAKMYLYLTFSCPNRCWFCYADGGRRTCSELSPGDFARIVRQGVEAGFESVVLLRGWSIMRKPGSNRSRRGDSLFITVFFIVILLGASVSIVLSDLRPNLYTEQNSASIDQPIVDEQWLEFKIHYPDRYYLDVDIEASEPATIKVVDASGAVVYEVTETSFHKQDLPVKLSRGTYKLSLSCTSGFDVKCKVQ